MLAPAACYPVYPIAAARGPCPPEGLDFDVAGDCFRREPSNDIDRLQSFRMREYRAHRRARTDRWRSASTGSRAPPEIAGALGLRHRVESASDPFFGRAGAMVGRYQAQQALKFEMLMPVRSAEKPTACMSFNYHRDHFGTTWGLRNAGGEPAHTGCVAFGMDRLAVALFADARRRCRAMAGVGQDDP